MSQETITISTRRLDYKGSQQFFKELFEAYHQGYEPLDTGLIKDSPRLGSVPRVVLYKVRDVATEAPESDSEGSSDTTTNVGTTASSETSVEALTALEGMTKKDELLAYAENLSIEIPSNLKQPAAIKKFLQEYKAPE